MAADAVQIEAEDEVPAIIERIRRSPADEVHLVLPLQARFGQSRFEFQLLRQYCTRLGKRVAVASADPVVQRLAEESGFGSIRLGANGSGPAAGRGERPRIGMGGGPPGPSGPPAAGPRPAAAALAPGAGAAMPPAAGQSRLGSIGRIGSAPAGARIRIGAPQRLPKQLAQFQPARSVLYGGAGLLLAVGVVAFTFSVPSARVTLVAQAQPFSQNVDLNADPGSKSIHVRTLSITKSASTGGTATGTKTSGGQFATGQFTYADACPTGFTIPNGQRVQTAGGVVFAQLGDTSIDPGHGATVSIKAVQAGQAGNVGAGQITVIADNQYPCLVGTNQAPTQGGVDDQKQTVIQSSDLNSARVQLEQTLRQQILDELNHGLQKGEKVSPQPVFGPEDFRTTHTVDDPSPTFTATLQVTVEGDYYASDDVDQAFAGQLRSHVPAGQQLTTNKVVASYAVTAAQGGHLEFTGTASGFVAPKIDTDRIRGQLVGKSAGQAHQVLTGLPVRRAVIDQSPFPLPLMPLSSSRIYIDYGIDQTALAPKSG